MTATKSLPDGTFVDPIGPTASQVSRVLSARGHTKSVSHGSRQAPTVGFVARKRPGSWYVRVSSTMPGFGLESYRRTLTSAGFIVTDDPAFGSGLAVYLPPRERDDAGKVVRGR